MEEGQDSSTREFGQTLAEAMRGTRLKVFLCGASIERGKLPRKRKRNARLRYEIMERLARENCEVILGEDKAFYTEAREALKAKSAYAEHELALAAEYADLTVIFPCSAGSFAEVGMFAVVREVGQRLAIVVDGRHEYKQGYIAKGPVLMAERHNADVAFLPYDDVDAVWEFVSDVVRRVRLLEWEREITSRR